MYASLSPSKSHSFDTHPGDYLEASLGTPPGVLEEQVRAILIFLAVGRFDKDTRAAFEGRSCGVCRSPE